MQSCACQRATHSSGNVEMVKEIGMRVGGPSVNQVRGMRSEGEMGERVGKESAHTLNKERRKKKDEIKQKKNSEHRQAGTRKQSGKPVCSANKRQNGARNVSKHLSCSYPKFQRPITSRSRNVAACNSNIKPQQRTDGGDVRGVEIVLSKTDDQTCFPHSAVPDEQQLEKEIVLFRHGWSCSANATQSGGGEKVGRSFFSSTERFKSRFPFPVS